MQAERSAEDDILDTKNLMYSQACSYSCEELLSRVAKYERKFDAAATAVTFRQLATLTAGGWDFVDVLSDNVTDWADPRLRQLVALGESLASEMDCAQLAMVAKAVQILWRLPAADLLRGPACWTCLPVRALTTLPPDHILPVACFACISEYSYTSGSPV